MSKQKGATANLNGNYQKQSSGSQNKPLPVNSTLLRALRYPKFSFNLLRHGLSFKKSGIIAVIAIIVGLAVSAAIPLLTSPAQAAATIPYKINFQGRLTNAAGNIVPDGSYNIKFRLYNALTSGTNVFQADRIYGASDHRVVVTNGLFSIQFGDTTQGDPALSPTLFSSSPFLFVEVEMPSANATCGSNGCATFSGTEIMSPRQPLGSSPYAFNADVLDGVDGASYARNDAANTFTTGDQAVNRTSTTAFQIQNAGGSGNLFIANTSNTVIGIGAAPSAGSDILQVTGSASATVSLKVGSNTSLSTSTLTIGGVGVCTSAGCSSTSTLQQAYGADADSADATLALTSADGNLIFQNPSSGGITSGAVLKLDQLNTGAVEGLRVESAGTGNLLTIRDTTTTATDVFKIANGGATTLQNQTDSASAFQVQNAAGQNLFIADTTSQKVTVNKGSLQITAALGNPTAPSLLTFASGGLLPNNSQYSYRISALIGTVETGVIASSPTSVTTANPCTPTPNQCRNSLTWSAVTGASSYNLYRLKTGGGNVWQKISVGNVLTYSDTLDANWSVSAYMSTANFTGSLAVDQGSPIVLDGNPTHSATSYLWSIPGNTTQLVNTAGGGGIELLSDSLHVINNVNYTVNFSIDNNGGAYFKNDANRATAFQVQNASGTALINVDTANSIVGTNSQIYTTGTISQSGTAVTGSGTTFVAGMVGGIIVYNNDNTTDTIAGFTDATHLTTTNSKTVSGGSTYKIIWGGLRIKSDGATSVQTTTNSTTAFQIQNSAGTSNLFVADTTNSKIGLGVAPGTTASYGILQVGASGSTAAAGGITFGADTVANLYRSTTSTLKTDGSLVVASGLTVSSLTNCSSLQTDASGVVSCGTPPDTAGFSDTTSDTLNDSSQDLWDGTQPNITPTASSQTVLVSVSVKIDAAGADDEVNRFQIYRSTSGSNATCSSTAVGGTFGARTTDNAGQFDNATVTFLDSPAVASQVRYTICESTESTIAAGGTVNNTTPEIYVSLVALGADLAENYYTSDTSLSAGQVVSIDSSLPAGVKKSVGAYDQAIGVVSTAPGKVLDDRMGEGFGRPVPIALSGRVPVKVSDEGGPIQVGDYLVASSIPGIAMKASHPGRIIGSAMSDFTGTGQGMVMVFVHTGYADPSNGTSLEEIQGNAKISGSLNVSGSANFGDLTVVGLTTTKGLIVTESATITKLTVTGLAEFKGGILVNGHVVTGGNTPMVQAEAAAGNGATVTIEGNDSSGMITVTTGTSPTTGQLTKIIFSKTYGAAPRVVLSPSNDPAGGLQYFKGTTTVADFILNTKNSPSPNTTYMFDYFIAQ